MPHYSRNSPYRTKPCFLACWALLIVSVFVLFSCKKNPEKTSSNQTQNQEAQNQEAQNQETQNQETQNQTEQKVGSINNLVELTDEQFRTLGIETVTAQERSVSEVLRANGMLDVPPQNVVSLSPRMGGYVRSTVLLQGLKVRKGQVLAVLEHQDIITLQQEFLDAKTRTDFLEEELKRQEILQKENINALKVYQQTESEYKSLLARFHALKQRLLLIGINPTNLSATSISAIYSIISPITGFVGDINVSLGQFISPNEVLCRIVNTEHVHAEIMIFERDAPKIREGQKVRIQLANEAKERLAKVYLIGREVSQERTVRIHAHLEEEDRGLFPNTAFKAAIELGEQKSLAVPESAVIQKDGQSFVICSMPREASKNHRFEVIPLQTGASAEGFIHLLDADSALSQRKIVTKGAYQLFSQWKNMSEPSAED